MEKKEEKNIIWDFVSNHTNLIYYLIISTIAIIVRVLLLEYRSGDYTMFLEPWFNELKVNGGLMGLSQNIGNYTPIYMTILALLTYIPVKSVVTIKLVSIIFDFIGAFTAKKIVDKLLSEKKNHESISWIIYGLYLFLPTVLFNSAYWAQCDGIYTTFILISILHLIKKNYKLSILFWSVALAFKFQAIFIFPLYVLVYIIERKIKLKYFLIIPITVFVLSLPKAILSHDLLVGFRIYLSQAGTYDQYITLNLPNFYSIFLSHGEKNLIYAPFKGMGMIGILSTFIILVTITYLAYIKKVKFDKNAIVEFALFIVLIMTFFLPQMHERYLYIGDVLGLLYLVINIKKYYVPIIVEFISLNGYMYLLFAGFAINFSTLSIAFLVLIILYTKDIYTKYLKL